MSGLMEKRDGRDLGRRPSPSPHPQAASLLGDNLARCLSDLFWKISGGGDSTACLGSHSQCSAATADRAKSVLELMDTPLF